MINILLILLFVFSSLPSNDAILPSSGRVEDVRPAAPVEQFHPISDEYDVIYPPTGTGSYVVCVDAAKVYGSPSRDRIVRYTLSRGTEVNVRERAKWTVEGWAMIKPAYWVSASDLCEPEK